jgi:hypothetical protein
MLRYAILLFADNKYGIPVQYATILFAIIKKSSGQVATG